MSFRLDRYEPVAFHTHPELMRAAEAQTAGAAPGRTIAGRGVAALGRAAHGACPRGPAYAAVAGHPAVPADPCGRAVPGVPRRRCRRRLRPWRHPRRSPRTSSAWTPPLCCAPRWPTSSTRAARGGTSGSASAWRTAHRCRGCSGDQVPYGVRAMPRYPETGPALDPDAALAATVAAVAADAADDPGRRQLVVLVWDRPPEPVAPAGLAGVGPGAALCRHGAQPARDERRRGLRLDPGPVASRVAALRCWVTPAGCWTVGRRSRTRRPASGWAAGPRSPLNYPVLSGRLGLW